MKKILIITLILSSIFLISCESEEEKLAKIEVERKIEDEKYQKAMQKKHLLLKKEEKELLDSLSRSELKVYNKYNPTYMLIFYKKDISTWEKTITGRKFTIVPPKNFFSESWKHLEYIDVVYWEKSKYVEKFFVDETNDYEYKYLNFEL